MKEITEFFGDIRRDNSTIFPHRISLPAFGK
jgi:hypothetical protein